MMNALLFGVVLALIFCFALTNGVLDGGGIVSTVITTRAMEPLPALIVVAACEVLGVSLLGHAVVRTMGSKMILFPSAAPAREILSVLAAAMSGALAWNTAMWRFSWPSSSSHALLGGLWGATWARFGSAAVAWPVVTKILIGLAAIPLGAALTGFLLSRFLYWVGEHLTPAVGGALRVLHIIALAGIALVHGSNDGQKSMALVFLAFLAFGWRVLRHISRLGWGLPAGRRWGWVCCSDRAERFKRWDRGFTGSRICRDSARRVRPCCSWAQAPSPGFRCLPRR